MVFWKAKVAPEGFIYIGVLALLAWVSALFGFKFVSIVLAIATFLMVYFFRDPDRLTPKDDFAVVAPADGRILDITVAREGHFLERDMKRISIFMSITDCHVNRAPLEGTVLGTKYVNGRFGLAYLGPSSEENERLSTLIESDDGERISVVQIAGFLARRIVSYTDVGSHLERGERIGMIKFGSRVDTYLPLHCEITTRIGDRVRSGETIIAWLRG